MDLAAWCRWAFAGRGEVWGLSLVAVVFPDVVRDIGGAVRPGVLGTLASFLGIGESLRAESEDCTRPACFSIFVPAELVD